MIGSEGGGTGPGPTVAVLAEAPTFSTSEIVILFLIVLLILAVGLTLTFGGIVVLHRWGRQTLGRRWLIVPVAVFDLFLLAAFVGPILSGDVPDPPLLMPPALHFAGWISGFLRRPAGRPPPD